MQTDFKVCILTHHASIVSAEITVYCVTASHLAANPVHEAVSKYELTKCDKPKK